MCLLLTKILFFILILFWYYCNSNNEYDLSHLPSFEIDPDLQEPWAIIDGNYLLMGVCNPYKKYSGFLIKTPLSFTKKAYGTKFTLKDGIELKFYGFIPSCKLDGEPKIPYDYIKPIIINKNTDDARAELIFDEINLIEKGKIKIEIWFQKIEKIYCDKWECFVCVLYGNECSGSFNFYREFKFYKNLNPNEIKECGVFLNSCVPENGLKCENKYQCKCKLSNVAKPFYDFCPYLYKEKCGLSEPPLPFFCPLCKTTDFIFNGGEGNFKWIEICEK